jgi:alginate O-acetyltransferase complex protein AlgI
MLFNSYEFIFAYLPLTLAVFFTSIRAFGRQAGMVWLAAASLFFYGWWNPPYLVLILISMLFNFGIGYAMANPRFEVSRQIKNILLATGVIANLSALGYYKYAHFITTNWDLVTGSHISLPPIVLPLAISFFTFQQITYLVDAYDGITKEYRLSHYMLFVTFFPHLLAGPIVHHKEMMPQFMHGDLSKPRADNISIGLVIFVIGLVKKAVLADGVAQYATPVFASATAGHAPDLLTSWGGTLSYTLQLYFDFSGYSDMAIGTARMFGIKLPLNFHSPYKSLSITEFWRRWHMTLSRFLREYIYIPLGGNRKGSLRRYINLGTTMLLGGLWHGAGWTFVLWGALHGFYLIIHLAWRHLLQKLGLTDIDNSRLWRGTAWAITFLAVIVGWVYFRAADMATAGLILKGMMGLNGVHIPNAIFVRLGGLQEILTALDITPELGGGNTFVATYAWVTGLMLIALLMPNTQEIMRRFHPALMPKNMPAEADSIGTPAIMMKPLNWSPTTGWAIAAAALTAFGVLAVSHVSEFLYFQF